jgi:hypothetical protein
MLASLAPLFLILVLFFSTLNSTLSATCSNSKDGVTSRALDAKCNIYLGNEEDCGSHDDEDFNAKLACCNCGGGVTFKCEDTDNEVTDKDGDGCTTYYSQPGICGGYDDADFDSNVLCW